MISTDYYDVAAFALFPLLYVVLVGLSYAMFSALGIEAYTAIAALALLVVCYRAYTDLRELLLDRGWLEPVAPRVDVNEDTDQLPDRENDPTYGRNLRSVMRDFGFIEQQNIDKKKMYEALGYSPALADGADTKRQQERKEAIDRKAEEVRHNITDYPEVKAKLDELRDKVRVRCRWAQNPEIGEATPDNPAVLLVEKKKSAKKRTLQKREFWGQLQGTKRLLNVADNWKNNDQFYALYLSDKATSLPDHVDADEIPEKLLFEDNPGRFHVGIDEAQSHRFVDFDKAPHILVAGASGSGKTVLQNWLLWQGVREGWKLSMIDPKQHAPDHIIKEYQDRDLLEDYTAHEKGELDCDTKGGYIQHIREVMSEEERRRSESNPHPMLFVIDEWPQVGPSFDGDCSDLVGQLVSISRSQMIFVVITLQTPKASNLDTSIRGNLNHRLVGALDEWDQVKKMFADTDEADRLQTQVTGGGQFLYEDKEQGDLTLVQAPYADYLDEDAEGGVSDFFGEQ